MLCVAALAEVWLLTRLALAAAPLAVHVQATVSADLRTVKGLLEIPRPPAGLTLVDALAALPQPADDATRSTTFPGRAEVGSVTWTEEGPDRWRFVATLPARYGGAGRVPGRGLWLDGGWFPQPLVDGELPTLAWSARVVDPEGRLVVVGSEVGWGSAAAAGVGDRVVLAALERARVTEIVQDDDTLRLVQSGPPRRRRDGEVLALWGALRPVDAPSSVAVVEAPLHRRLRRGGAGVVLLSHRAFAVTPLLERFHRGAVAEGLLVALMPHPEDPWLRRVAARALVEGRREELGAGDADRAVGWARFLPSIDSLLYDGNTPFFAEIAGRPFPSDPLADDLAERVVPHSAPGAVVAWCEALVPGSAALLGARLAAGDPLEVAAAAAGLDATLVASWRRTWGPEDLLLAVGRTEAGWEATVRRDAPSDAPAVPVELVLDGERQVALTPPGGTVQVASAQAPLGVEADPAGLVREADESHNRWPDRLSAVVYGGVGGIDLTDRALVAQAGLLVQRLNGGPLALSAAVGTSESTLANLRLGAAWRLGAALDGRRREHTLSAVVAPELLNPSYRPTDDAWMVLGGGVGWAWDTRVSTTFPVAGHRLSAGAEAGLAPIAPAGEQRWWAVGVDGVWLWSPHPRVVLAGLLDGGLAGGRVDHRLLPVGGLRGLASVPAGALVGEQVALGKVELRVVPLRNVQVPALVGLGTELQLTAGLEGGLVGGARPLGELPDDPTWRLVGVTAGAGVVFDWFGFRPYLGAATVGRVVLSEPELPEARPQVQVRWDQAF